MQDTNLCCKGKHLLDKLLCVGRLFEKQLHNGSQQLQLDLQMIMQNTHTSFLPARRCASTVLAKAPCPCVFPSQAGIVSKQLDGSSLFWHRGYPCLILRYVVREFGYLQKSGYFPLELCANSVDLEKFCHSTSTVASSVNLVLVCLSL